MITIRTSNNERAVSELLIKLLKDEGYAFSGGHDLGVIHAHKKGALQANDLIGNIIVEAVKALCEERKASIYRHILDLVERPMIEYALKTADGNQLKAAKALGINRNTMRNKIKKLEIRYDTWKR